MGANPMGTNPQGSNPQGWEPRGTRPARRKLRGRHFVGPKLREWSLVVKWFSSVNIRGYPPCTAMFMNIVFKKEKKVSLDSLKTSKF